MPQITTNTLNIDLTRIENAEIRRALRQLVQQLQETITQQQVEIEALLEMMLDKNLSSMSEFRIHVQRIAHRVGDRSDRVHSQIAQSMRDRASLEASPREADFHEEDGRRVYRL